MKIGVYGGTFNPPHKGHEAAARRAFEALGLDKLLLIPANLPPHKPLPEGTPDAVHRLAMTERMALGLPFAVVSDIEITRPGPSFTVDTLRSLGAQYPEGILYLIVGGDMLAHMPQWRDVQSIVRMCRIAALCRQCNESLEPLAGRLRRDYGAVVELVTSDPIEVSSSELRANPARLKSMTPAAVYDYIDQNHLYGVNCLAL